MSRRPLVPLLALAALLALPPAVRGISCYQCSDQQNNIGEEGAGSIYLPNCSEFDEDDNKYQQKSCGVDKSCSKIIFKNGQVVRGCYPSEKADGCNNVDGLTECFCSTDFCNSAGLSTPALLLLLPAALLAALYTV
ncbi:hypothetical protein FJT64_013687 [Amphibalanus amphitrite]|uniref:Uncharacterized protein n=1 Tax=Amphibalanus amphitrite TaxID=1232801 RepID=A0A6A4VEB1_AMPAM|nr:hypothetical protein FJT64_013687 [Amphibalanus amphitrite]